MFIGVIYTLGIFLGAFLGSKLSDFFGRKLMLLVFSFLFCCASLSLTFVPNVIIMLGVLFIIGISCAGGTMISFVYVNELLSPQKRSIYGTLINSSFAIAGLIYFSCFQFINNWRLICYIAIIVNVISGLIVLIYLVESPRYLFSKGYYRKSLTCLYKISYKNNKDKEFYRFLVDSTISVADKSGDIDYSTNDSSHEIESKSSQSNKLKYKIKKLIKECRIESDESNGQKGSEPLINKGDLAFKKNEQASFKSLFKYASIRKNFLSCCFIWFATCLSYYGLSFGLKNFYGDVFTNGYVVYCAEGISYMITGIVISIPSLGRKYSLIMMSSIASTSFVLYFFFEKVDLINTIIIFFARFGVTSMYSIMYIISTEIYPTIIRAKGLGLNTVCARIGGILVPILVEKLNPKSTMVLFSTICFISLLVSFYLSETFNKELEDDIQEEKIKEGKKILVD